MGTEIHPKPIEPNEGQGTPESAKFPTADVICLIMILSFGGLAGAGIRGWYQNPSYSDLTERHEMVLKLYNETRSENVKIDYKLHLANEELDMLRLEKAK